MATVIARHWGNQLIPRRKTVFPSRNFSSAKIRKKIIGKTSDADNSGIRSSALVLAAALILAGAIYLYQVNTIVSKGYEIKEVENKIQDLQKESQNLKIKEVELKSMYNIEKSMEELNLVISSSISYVETDGPVAMK